ncbi:ABC transporter ATP-binding protein [Lewinella sp. W8]|uniref:ATP-binding cassette domain-containing protein n=1 Tax=Lewinella sp. W8 TaxID=2528208 RepID=UPI0010682B9C|nr:ABC transporter ATP-binding protein [Lewinella sp. W8]MTB51042.1 ATP-binding cassette domain-containing protein [Lewinella sp. W8]
MPATPLLRVELLTIAFGDAPPVVDDLSFVLAAGESLGLIGVSGSGKSITALALLGLLPSGARILRGHAWWLGGSAPVDLLTLSEREWRAYRGGELSLVFQEPLTALNPVQRIDQQLREAIPRTKRADWQSALPAALEEVELGTEGTRILRAYPHQLSGGQRQRILIALALLRSPRLLIADEPTTALDSITEREIIALLARIRDRHGMTMIFITHDLRVLGQITERLLVLRDGKTVTVGPTKALLRAPDAPYLANLLAATFLRPHQTAAPAETSPPLLSVKELSVEYVGSKPWPWATPPRKVAVRNASLTLFPGEWVAIVGPSGCGKTTLARTLAGLHHASTGTIMGNLGPQAIQLVFQDPFGSLNPSHKITTILGEVLRVHQPKLKKAALLTRIHELLEAVELSPGEYADRLPDALSGGQRQRVAIARALAANPSILICDEAVSALDAPLQRGVLDLLARLQTERGLSILFITHDLYLAENRADRVIIMDNGEIVEQGPTKEIVAAPESEMGRRLLAARGR